ncbi:MAG: thiamine pyrophosphate-dependent enzyme [bacterium]
MEKILKNKGKSILLGNEAIVQGALESGVQFVSTYPGTPASEIGNIFSKIFNCNPTGSLALRAIQQFSIFNKKKKRDFYFEYSVNEKVAIEAGIGASFSGLKTLVAMKNFGANVCLDSLGPFCYTGSKGATVIVVADDPSCHSSAQWEENTRGISHLVNVPTLEPSDPQECKDFTKLAFEISEKFKIPVMLRTTTRVAHQRMPVEITQSSKLKAQNFKSGKFIKNPKQFITMPPRVLEMKKELLEKIKKIKIFAEKSEINFSEAQSHKLQTTNYKLQTTNLGIVASGISFLYVQEALKELKINLPVLKLGFFYPLPEEKIKKFIKPLKKVLIVEELDPYLEKEVARFAKEINPKLEIFGKNLLPEIGELKPEMVFSVIAKFANFKLSPCGKCPEGTKIPARFPQLCPGCPYWFVFSAIKKAVNPNKVIFGGDIGCYMLFGAPSMNMQDYLFCMGSSIGIAHGIKKSANQKLITFIGDATFFHAGIPALINAVHNQSNPLIIIMDNQTTAMTGHQPHPGIKNDNQPIIKIEDVVSACGVKHLKILDPMKNFEDLIKTIKEFLKQKEVSVIIARRPCARLK